MSIRACEAARRMLELQLHSAGCIVTETSFPCIKYSRRADGRQRAKMCEKSAGWLRFWGLRSARLPGDFHQADDLFCESLHVLLFGCGVRLAVFGNIHGALAQIDQ